MGLPIGDITSQLFSNILLDQMDRFVKRNLRCRHYGRYVDEFYVVHASRRYLKSLTACLQWFLQSELHLTLHPDKIVLQPYHYGVAFLGAYVKPYRRYATKSSVERFRRKIRVLEAECRRGELTYVRLLGIRSVLNSYCGYFCHFKAYGMLRTQFGKSPLRKFFDFTDGYGKSVLKKKFIPEGIPFDGTQDD